MRFKRIVFLTAVVVAMGLLLGASTAQAATVDLEGATAVRINNLDVNGTFYNVTFTAGTWADAYGGQPPELDVNGITEAADFIEEINKALTISQARTVGEPGATEDASLYMIAYAWDESEEFFVSWLGGFYADRIEDGTWISQIDGNGFGGDYPGDSGSMWANITQVEDAPPGQATLISPSGTITANTPTYTWNAVGTSIWYFLQVSDSVGDVVYGWYTPDEANCGDNTNECSVTPDIVLPDGSYNWRIQAWNEFGLGPWSDALSFNVDTTGTEPPETNVETDGDGNVIRITNLPVINETTGENINYNVDFVYDTGNNVYGDPPVFDFPSDETIFLALEAVMGALNAEDPTPLTAGPQGTDQFFIGNKEDSGIIAAVGGENFVGVWDQCDATAPVVDGVECLAGVAVLFPGDSFTYADFTVAD